MSGYGSTHTAASRLCRVLLCAVIAILFSWGPTWAFTLEFAPQKVEELEKAYDEMLMDLSDLEQELERITAKGAPLKERADYVDRILDLRSRLIAIESRRRELLGKLEELPHAPPILKLVDIDVPAVGEDVAVNGAGLVLHREDEVVHDNLSAPDVITTEGSLRIVEAPLLIRPDSSFRIRAEAMMLRSYPEGHRCLWPDDEGDDSDFLGLAMSSKTANAFVRGTKNLQSYCKISTAAKPAKHDGTKGVSYVKGATTKKDTVNLTMSFTPLKKRVDARWQKYYYDVSASGSGPATVEVDTESPFYVFSMPTDDRGYLLPTADKYAMGEGEGADGIKISVRLPLAASLTLHYEPVRETDPALTSLNVPEHPAGLSGPAVEGKVRSVIVMPDVVGIHGSAAKKQLEELGLTVALRPGSPPDGAGESQAVEAQEPAPGMDVAGGAAVTLTVHPPYVSRTEVPDLTGRPLAYAREAVKHLGLWPRLRSAGPAPSSELSGTIASQEPIGGAKVGDGTEVILRVYSALVEERTVPEVAGLSVTLARAGIAEAGLKALLKPGGKPGSQEQAGKVERQSPAAGATVLPGTEVEIYVYGPFTAGVTVPNVRNLTYGAARERIEAAGLQMEAKSAGRAKNEAQAGKASSQEPAPGARTGRGNVVLVAFYSDYTAPPLPDRPGDEGPPRRREKLDVASLCPPSLTMRKNTPRLYTENTYPPGTQAPFRKGKYSGTAREEEGRLTNRDPASYRKMKLSCNYQVSRKIETGWAMLRIVWWPEDQHVSSLSTANLCRKDAETDKMRLLPGSPPIDHKALFVASRTRMVRVEGEFNLVDRDELYAHARRIVKKLEPHAMLCDLAAIPRDKGRNGTGTGGSGGGGGTGDTGTSVLPDGGGSDIDGELCPCVDERGVRYRVMYGQQCGGSEETAPRNYDCSE